MTVVINGTHPEVEELLARRRDRGLDGRDEVWEGVYHVVPHANAAHSRIQVQLVTVLTARLDPEKLFVTVEFNLGEPDDYRVPDLGVHESDVSGLYVSTAVAVFEVLSPDDKTFQKFDFYHRHGVQEMVVVDPQRRQVRVWQRGTSHFVEGHDLKFANISCHDLEILLRWPQSRA